MGFTPISIDDYLSFHLADYPDLDTKNFRQRLSKALNDYKNGVKCHCGNDTWVIGSATAWNSCFLCLTGEISPDVDFKIDEAMDKLIININTELGRKGRFFQDDGSEYKPDLYPKPGLCLTCFYDENPDEEYLCVLNRLDQEGSGNFYCTPYKKI